MYIMSTFGKISDDQLAALTGANITSPTFAGNATVDAPDKISNYEDGKKIIHKLSTVAVLALVLGIGAYLLLVSETRKQEVSGAPSAQKLAEKYIDASEFEITRHC